MSNLIELVYRVHRFFVSAISNSLKATAILMVSAYVSADYLVMEGAVTGMANTSSSQANFAVWVSGGSLNHCEDIYIKFPEADAAETQQQTRNLRVGAAGSRRPWPFSFRSIVSRAEV